MTCKFAIPFLISCWTCSTSGLQTSFKPPTFSLCKTCLHGSSAEDGASGISGKPVGLFKRAKKTSEYESIVADKFPGAITNKELVTRVVQVLRNRGFKTSDTLLATSLCCDELARCLEEDFCKEYGNNFSLGGSAGFPFAGNTGFNVMTDHIPDDGSCLIIFGPHVGVSKCGVVGKVERDGTNLIDDCCQSAVAASNYVKGITDGGALIARRSSGFGDLQQAAVQNLLLPYGKRLSEAKDRMLTLPFALFDSQDQMMQDIVQKGAIGFKEKGGVLLGGIQINTAPGTSDYFLPLRFVHINEDGETVEDLLTCLTSVWD